MVKYLTRNIKSIFFALLAAIILQGCSVYPLVETGLNMPLPDSIHSIKGNLRYCTAGISLQASYAIDSHIVVTGDVSGNNIKRKIVAEDAVMQVYPSNFLFNAGAGYYCKIGRYGRFEALGGVGYSTISTIYKDSGFDEKTTQALTGSVWNVNIQADIGHVDNRLEYGFGVQLKTVFFNGYNSTAFNPYYNPDTVFNYKTPMNNAAIYIQPNFMVAYGFERFKIQAAIGVAVRFIGDRQDFSYQDLSLDPVFLSAGVAFNLCPRKKK